MARKRALVVDDSKSARVILSRMLEKYDIEVDMAESAEQAIDYLKNDRPDAIFMDHLMPGMDGLQAVQVIKSNPQTAMIPIMMYTSQEGELYVGQARALGAMGVLPKQVRPVDVSKVLYELHLLPDRRDMDEPALLPVDLGMAIPSRAGTPLAAIMPTAVPEWSRRLEATIRDQSADLRRFVVASLDSLATRIISDVQGVMPPTSNQTQPAAVPSPKPMWLWQAGLLAACSLAVLFGVMWSLERDELARSQAQRAALTSANAQLKHAEDELAAAVKVLSTAAAGMAVTSYAPRGGASRAETVPYGELPFDRSRLEVLRDLLTSLEAQGFRGVVRMTSMAGLFCLSGTADGYALATASSPASKCDLVGNPFEDSLSGQQRQSLAFANLVASIRHRTDGAITVALDNAGSSRAPVPYPVRNEALTAGEWNRVAVANNRVEFTAEPVTAPGTTASDAAAQGNAPARVATP